MQGLHQDRPLEARQGGPLKESFSFHQHWKHNRSVIDSEEDSSDDSTQGHSHRPNPTPTILPSSSSSSASAISLRAGPRTLQSQHKHLHVSRPALYHIPAGSPLRLADQAWNQRGAAQFAEIREIRPVSLRTIPDTNFFHQDSVSVRRGSNLQDSLPSPSIACG